MFEKRKLRYNVIDDYPSKGVRFIDLTPTLNDYSSFNSTINKLCKMIPDDCNYILCTEARGFIWGSAVSIKKKLPLVIVRKKGRLPECVIKESITYKTEYSTDILQIPNIDLKNKKCCYIDDVFATGVTYDACIKLVSKVGGKLCYGCVIYDVGFNSREEVKSIFRGNDL